MKDIKILGTGCPKCKQTTAIVEETVSRLGIDATVEKVEDIMEIMKYNVMSTPAVVVDGNVVFKGRVPTATEVEAMLAN
ncbi:MAG: TM0996/MTH895 family glutaredoxin-like protein [Saprospiraceae bacterium]|jgi:small redox-active disulfide protein 2|nr:TM0996/MTH895 family glutaredoxin-like protein [Saprospiraceae bacterium]